MPTSRPVGEGVFANSEIDVPESSIAGSITYIVNPASPVAQMRTNDDLLTDIFLDISDKEPPSFAINIAPTEQSDRSIDDFLAANERLLVEDYSQVALFDDYNRGLSRLGRWKTGMGITAAALFAASSQYLGIDIPSTDSFNVPLGLTRIGVAIISGALGYFCGNQITSEVGTVVVNRMKPDLYLNKNILRDMHGSLMYARSMNLL